jgi:hypothetical protein
MKSQFNVSICQTEGDEGLPLVMYLQVAADAPSCQDCLKRESENPKVYGYRLRESNGYKLIELKFMTEALGNTWLDHVIENSGEAYLKTEVAVTDSCCALSWLDKVTAITFVEGDAGFSLCAEDKIIYLYFLSKEATQKYIRDTMKLLRPVKIKTKKE